MGLNETNYRTNHDSFVTKTIAQYSARMSTNLRHDALLPNFIEMNNQERSAALQQVDQLLDRLSSSGVVDVSSINAASRERSNIESQSINVGNGSHFGRRTGTKSTAHHDSVNHQNNETFGSATTLGEGGHDETFGSATTLGENNLEESNKRLSAGSAITTLGNNKSLASATTMGDGCEDQSVSLLEDSMILLSGDDEAGSDHVDDEDDSRFSGGDDTDIRSERGHQRNYRQRSSNVAPIERTRHYQHALDDNEMRLESSTPPFSNHKLNSKRCASNSGKRGLKSRHRSSHDGEDDDYEDSLLLVNFDGIDGSGCGGGLFLHDQEDAFSCGSPIQRRFSNDGLESELDDGESMNRLHDLPHREKSISANNRDESEGDSRFSMQDDDNDNVSFNGGNDDYYDDEDGGDNGGGGGNWNESQRPNTQKQLSQWNIFRNADAELTYTQVGDNEQNEREESPVRRRAIRFDGASQLQSQHRSQQRYSNLKGGGEDTDMVDNVAERDLQRSKQHSSKKVKDIEGDGDHIQTVRNLCRRAKTLEEQGVDSSLLEEVAPIDVRLRDGMHFRMDPLRCRQEKKETKSAFKSRTAKNKKGTKAVSIVHPGGKAKSKQSNRGGETFSDSENSLSDPEQPSFKDPISDFPSRVAARLNAGLNFLVDKEGDAARCASEEDAEDERGNSSAVLLSMTVRQIVCVTSKLLLQTIKSTRRHQRSKNRLSSTRRRYTPTASNAPPKVDDYLAGGTLIVLRGKEDIGQWEVALREYTSLSCFNHAGMQSMLRKLPNTAGKCAGFDVVLTTYDAIKSKEVTVPVDSAGCAILGSNASSNGKGGEDGWLTCRGGSGNTQSDGGVSAPQKCHQLSALHRMSWFRVIFMDVLGRKGIS